MFDTICTLPLTSDLFAQAIHPTWPLITVGLTSGHVQTFNLPPAAGSDDEGEPPTSTNLTTTNGTASIISSLRRSSTASENGLGAISTAWRTRRHRGSCRCLTFSYDGDVIYSAGTDGIVKAAATETGRVISKLGIPLDSRTGQVDKPGVIHALSPQTLLLATDSGRLYVHDLRDGGAAIQPKASSVFRPHDEDFVSSITPLPPTEASTSGFSKQWVTTGGTTLAVTDLRKGVLRKSEDQEEELTSSLFLSGLKKGGTSQGEKVLVGGGGGVVTLWERGVWDDQDERIVVDRDSAIECMVEAPTGHDGVGSSRFGKKVVAFGLEDGRVRFVEMGKNKVVQELDIKHDEVDGVTAIGFDIGGRMISGGGSFVKVWHTAAGLPGGMRGVSGKHGLDSDNSSDDEEVDDSSDQEDREKTRRKKRKRNKGKDKSGGKALALSGFDFS